MPAPNLPNTLLKLGLALAKHHIKNVIGDEALEIAASTLTDVGGEKVQAKVDSIFASQEGQKELLKAAKNADESFQKKCKDNDLRSLFTMGYGDLPSVQTAIAKLPEALDDETLRGTLFKAFRNDTPKSISDDKLYEGVNLYVECLQSALVSVQKFGLRIIHNALKEIGMDVKDIKADVKLLLEKTKTDQQIDRHIINFDTLISEKTNGFVGRQFVFNALDAFLTEEKSGYFVIRGEPGIGKTSLVSKLVSNRGYIHHFNVASLNIRSTRVFLENVCAQLIVRYNLPHNQLPLNFADDGNFLTQCLREVAVNSTNHPIVVAIDSLDEVERLGLASAVNTLYLPSSLPQGVYIVVTTRPLQDLHLQVMRQRTLDIEADSNGNLHDIDAYITSYVERKAMQARLSIWKIETKLFIAALRKKSQGNFMYLYYVLPAIEQGKFNEGTLDELPDGLMAYYQRHWRQMRDGKEKDFDAIYAPIVCILGVAQEPVTTDQIAAWTKLPHGQVKDSIGLWREFLQEKQINKRHCYRIYHSSFQDFLKERVDLQRFDNMIADYYLSLSEQEP
jgi:hypothetical protein